MPVPTPREFRRLYRRMDLPTRADLSQRVRSGAVAEDPEEAGLLAAAAERELRQARWTIVLMATLAGLNLLTVFLVASPAVRWMSVGVVALAAVGVLVTMVGSGPLRRSKRINWERAGGAGD